jgi:hypothetical protein
MKRVGGYPIARCYKLRESSKYKLMKKRASNKSSSQRGNSQRSSSRARGGRGRTLRASARTRAASRRSSRGGASRSRSAGSRRTSTGSSRSAESTTDHDEIREWVESRGGRPAIVSSTSRTGGAGGVLRIDFPGFSGEGALQEASWDEWFRIFDEQGLAFSYQDKPQSRFNKLVNRGNQGRRGMGTSARM